MHDSPLPPNPKTPLGRGGSHSSGTATPAARAGAQRPPLLGPPHDLVAVALMGRAGNQLFQVAAARALQADPFGPVAVAPRESHRWGRPLERVLRNDALRDLGQRELMRFRQLPRLPRGNLKAAVWRDHVADRVPWLRHYELLVAEPIGYDSRFDAIEPPVFLRGFLQSERYFAGAEDAVLASVQDPDSEALAIGEHLCSGGQPTVAVTLRTARDYQHFGWVLPFSFYLDACALLAERLGDLRLTVFGDEAATCERAAQRLGRFGRTVVAANLDPVTQLQVIRMHDHVVLANSSFSWWCAWLSERWARRSDAGIFVAPDPWLNPGDELVPSRWVRLARQLSERSHPTAPARSVTLPNDDVAPSGEVVTDHAPAALYRSSVSR